MENIEYFINELLKKTKNNEIEWINKPVNILSDFIPNGKDLINIYSTKYKGNSIYICVRKYVVKNLDHPHFKNESFNDEYKYSVIISDGIELLHTIEIKEDQNYSYNFNELKNIIQNIITSNIKKIFES